MRFDDCQYEIAPWRLWVESVLLKRCDVKSHIFSLLSAFLVGESHGVVTVVVAWCPNFKSKSSPCHSAWLTNTVGILLTVNWFATRWYDSWVVVQHSPIKRKVQSDGHRLTGGTLRLSKSGIQPSVWPMLQNILSHHSRKSLIELIIKAVLAFNVKKISAYVVFEPMITNACDGCQTGFQRSR